MTVVRQEVVVHNVHMIIPTYQTFQTYQHQYHQYQPYQYFPLERIEIFAVLGLGWGGTLLVIIR